MLSNIKKILLAIAISFLVFMLVGSAPTMLFAQEKIGTTEEESTDKECTGDECGTLDAEEVEPAVSCTEDRWVCGDWSKCSAGVQTRDCSMAFNCKSAKTAKPAEEQKCEEEQTKPSCTKDTWTCTAWSECYQEGAQTRTCKLAEDCKGVETAKPAEKQSCAPAAITQPVEKPVVKDEPVTKDDSETKNKIQPLPVCTADTWACEAWGACPNGVQFRTCKMTYDCPTVNTTKPAEKQECKASEPKPAPIESKPSEPGSAPTVPETPSQPICKEDLWACESWSICENNLQYRNCKLAYDCPDAKTAQPAVKQLCTPAITCDAAADNDRDGIPCPDDKDDFNPDINSDGVLDGLEDVQPSIGAAAVTEPEDPEEHATYVELVSGGSSPQEAIKIIEKTYKKTRAYKRIKKIRKTYETTYKKRIETNKDDDDSDGISNEVAIALKINPKIELKEPARDTSVAEMKIYSSNPKLFGKKCTTNIYSGYTLPADGFTILAACPANKYFTLYAIDENGRQTAVKTEKASVNNKIVFDIDKKFREGQYLMQVRRTSRYAYNYMHLQSINEEFESEDSDPVLVNLVRDVDLAQPVVHAIENVDISRLKDIEISATEDGRVRVTGRSDISSMVVGTFQSAVFTSALFADVESGSFEIVSRPLELGEHEVDIYAVRPEESLQSAPVKIKFTIVEVAKAASPGMREAAPEKTFPLTPVLAIAGLAILFTAIGIYLKKRNQQ